MIKRSFLFAVLHGAALLALTGCGFQLRGQTQLPEVLSIVRLEAPQQNFALSQPLLDRLRELLRISGATLSEQASSRIVLSDIALRRRTLATGASGNAREFTLTLSATLQVYDSTSTELLPPSEIKATRDLLYRETELLGSLEGEKLAQRELTHELANAILRRLQRL